MHIPRKRFGQHFLCDQAIIQRIIAALHIKSHDRLVEIGAGQGALTIPLLKEVHALDVIELDRDLIPGLQERSKGKGELTIHATDALAFNFASLKTDDRLLRIVGNLPYNISTPLLFHLLTFAPYIADMLFMLQKEVAERLVAVANSDAYGRLSVMMQYHCEVELLFDVAPTAFYPPPQVHSSIVRLQPHRDYPYRARHYEVFAAIVKQAFNQRRKTLRNSLKNRVADEVWARLPIDSKWRAENLSVKDFVLISDEVTQ